MINVCETEKVGLDFAFHDFRFQFLKCIRKVKGKVRNFI